MRRRESIRLAAILLIAALAAWVSIPNNPGIHFSLGDNDVDVDFRTVLGLDLQGGLQVLLEANAPAGLAVNREMLTAAKSIIESRVNEFGTTEPVVQIQGDNRIVVEMPGVKSAADRERAVRLFGETGLLEFMDTGAFSPPPGTRVEEGQYPTVLTGKNLDSRAVSVGFDERNRPEILFGWDPEGAKTFGEYTETHINQYLAIVLDKTVLSAPRINSRIDSSGRITGAFTLQEARDIVTKLKYGALPIPMKVVQQREIGATLGEDSVRKSITAGAVGLAIVMAFMLFYYRLPGLLADVALLIYALITLAIFKNPWAPVTLTLAGIAGFILSIGMAVDANVLIFERMKEELRAGRPLVSAMEAGFSRAWSSIFDSNSTTLITCAILFYLGSGIIRGFAITLAVGVLVSLFSSITVTRTLLRAVVGSGVIRHPWFYGVNRPPTAEAPPRRSSFATAGV
ncbi:MAG TPA: protein translocase subunit SecD [Chloroflexota bacterium]|nr:protein translocase subunit SecD [Chloroflexota bacterium]